MSNLTYAQLEQVWLVAAKGTKYATQQWAALMAAIAEAESSGNPNATNPTDNNGTQTSWGLWQISNGTHSSVSPNWNDPVTNAKLAIQKLNGAGGAGPFPTCPACSPWGTYTSGAYKQYLNTSSSPATGQVPGSGSTGSTNPGNTGAANPGTNAQDLSANTGDSSNTGTCVLSWPAFNFGGLLGLGSVSGGGGCIIAKSNVRAMLAVAVMGTGAVWMALGFYMLLKSTGPGQAVAQLAGKAGSVGGTAITWFAAPELDVAKAASKRAPVTKAGRRREARAAGFRREISAQQSQQITANRERRLRTTRYGTPENPGGTVSPTDTALQ